MYAEESDDHGGVDEDQGVADDDERGSLNIAAAKAFTALLLAGPIITNLEEDAGDGRKQGCGIGQAIGNGKGEFVGVAGGVP